MAGTGRRVHATLSYEFFSFIMFCLFVCFFFHWGRKSIQCKMLRLVNNPLPGCILHNMFPFFYKIAPCKQNNDIDIKYHIFRRNKFSSHQEDFYACSTLLWKFWETFQCAIRRFGFRHRRERHFLRFVTEHSHNNVFVHHKSTSTKCMLVQTLV